MIKFYFQKVKLEFIEKLVCQNKSGSVGKVLASKARDLRFDSRPQLGALI